MSFLYLWLLMIDHFLYYYFLKDTHSEKTLSNKSPAFTKSSTYVTRKIIFFDPTLPYVTIVQNPSTSYHSLL